MVTLVAAIAADGPQDKRGVSVGVVGPHCVVLQALSKHYVAFHVTVGCGMGSWRRSVSWCRDAWSST